MNTQTLRGMANHGAEHWRGDRTRNFQDQTGEQPNSGSLDENNSFGEFDVAIPGLNGNDTPLAPAVFQSFTDFALQLTLPPNPVRALDDSLDAPRTRARAVYFGCASMTDDQFEQRQCVSSDGSLVDLDDETRSCACANNPLVTALHQAPSIRGLGQLLQASLSNADLRAAFLARAADPSGLDAAAIGNLPALSTALSTSIDELLAADLSLGAKGLFSAQAAQALSALTGTTLRVAGLPRTPSPPSLFQLLFDALPSNTPFESPRALQSAFESGFALANFDVRAVQDEALRGKPGFHNLLTGCDPSEEIPECRLRATDGVQTCHGCHTLDPRGNAKFDVYRPGFFGTSGQYSFENESQVFKVPQLRNLYQKVGMFGAPQASTILGESVLGPRLGGFFAPDSSYQGPQVRGVSFLHDGAIDTVERFHGALVFVARPQNPGGLEAVFPAEQTRASCIANFRAGTPDNLGAIDPDLRPALALCSSASPIPDVCFLDPGAAACQRALQAIGEAVDQPEFPTTFAEQILPACFQFGSMLEGGSPDGVCAPSGLRERADMESFMLAFDSNLRPMVGQQLTLHGSAGNAAFLRQLLRSAQLGQCDLALRQRNQGYLLTQPDADRSERSVLQRANGRTTTLGSLRRAADPITLTCYPPSPDQAEARRSAFDPRRQTHRLSAE
jgi:hypothetical protein